jgi:hypothetical protein
VANNVAYTKSNLNRNNDPMMLEAYNGQNPTVNTISEAYKYLLTILPSAKSI